MSKTSDHSPSKGFPLPASGWASAGAAKQETTQASAAAIRIDFAPIIGSTSRNKPQVPHVLDFYPLGHGWREQAVDFFGKPRLPRDFEGDRLLDHLRR